MSERDIIRVWMREVMERREWSAEHWARAAGTSPTNITRLLAGTATSTPATTTLVKLGQAAGSFPQLARLGTHTTVGRQVPLLDDTGLRALARGAALRKRGMVTTMEDVSDRAFAVTVGWPGMELKGIRPGDVVVCEPTAIEKPRNGKVVIGCHGEEMVIGQVNGEQLLRYSDDLGHLPLAEIEIMGVCREVRRSL